MVSVVGPHTNASAEGVFVFIGNPQCFFIDSPKRPIRNQFSRESEEQHRKRFIEMVRNGEWKIREEIVKSLFAVYLNRAYR